MNEGIRKGAFLFLTECAGCMESVVYLLAGMPVDYKEDRYTTVYGYMD